MRDDGNRPLWARHHRAAVAGFTQFRALLPATHRLRRRMSKENHVVHPKVASPARRGLLPIRELAMRRLYEWQVRLGSGQKLASCGVTDEPMRARRRMLDALDVTPVGEVAQGSVTVMELALPHDYYDYFQTLAVVHRDCNGTVCWLSPTATAKIITYTDLSGCLRTAIDLRGTA